MTPYDLMDRTELVLASSWLPNPSVQFCGFAYTDDAIIIRKAGLDAYLASHALDPASLNEGRFCLCIKTPDGYLAKTDAFGQDAVFYYCEGENWALSNSFYALARHLSEHGVPLNPYTPALSPFFVDHSSMRQLVSNRTAIQQIKVLPADSMLLLAPSTGQYWLKRTHSLDFWRKTEYSEYEGLMVAHATKWASRIASLAAARGADIDMGISGGEDSRLVLSTVLASGADLSAITFISNPDWVRDFDLAHTIAETHGFNITNRNRPYQRPTAETAYELWKHGNLGIYISVYPPQSANSSNVFHLHGACGESLRNYYIASASAMIGMLAPKAPENLQHALRHEFNRGIDEIYVSDERTAVPMDHFRHFQARFHFGRNWYRSLDANLITPLASLELMKAWGALSAEQRERRQLFCDILLLCCPSLATMPFDDPKKAYASEALQVSPFYRHRPDITKNMTHLQIYGPTIADELAGPPTAGGDMLKVMEAEVVAKLEAARSLNVLPQSVIDMALQLPKSTSVRNEISRAAALVVSAGEIALLCSSG